jgi:hypothetical protein
MEFLELLETIRAEEASTQRLFNSQEDGRGVRSLSRAQNPKYMARLKTAAQFLAECYSGRRRHPVQAIMEAMSTSDFPLLFGDTIDRAMLAKYQTIQPVWTTFLRRGTVRDFRNAKRFRCTRGSSMLDEVPQGKSYEADHIGEMFYQFTVKKYGRRRDILWEALVNDDLDALKDAPDDLAYQARNTEAYVASSQYVANATLYGNHVVNGVTYTNLGHKVLTVESLEEAVLAMSMFTDEGGIPIVNAPKYLVTGPALSLTAKKILRSIELAFTGTADKSHPTINILQGELEPLIDYFIPILDPTHGNTSWYLFADPNAQGWPAEVAFLQGHETPELFMKSPNQILLGGGASNPMDGDFDTDAVGGWRFTYQSDGTV